MIWALSGPFRCEQVECGAGKRGILHGLRGASNAGVDLMPIPLKNRAFHPKNMPATTIALGFGHLPQDHAKNTVLDVHLHLDHPATPISMGERSGPQSTGAGFTLQAATEYRHEDICEPAAATGSDKWRRRSV